MKDTMLVAFTFASFKGSGDQTYSSRRLHSDQMENDIGNSWNNQPDQQSAVFARVVRGQVRPTSQNTSEMIVDALWNIDVQSWQDAHNFKSTHYCYILEIGRMNDCARWKSREWYKYSKKSLSILSLYEGHYNIKGKFKSIKKTKFMG